MRARDGIHIFGASGSGTTTLGAGVADALAVAHLDTDDFYWRRTEPPFTEKRPVAERLSDLARAMDHRAGEGAGGGVRWVLSGSLCSWGDPLLYRFSLAVFLRLDPSLRMQRLLARERARYGAAIEPGGAMREAHLAFVDWAARYDDADTSIRSLAMHRAWMKTLPCPVLELDGALPAERLVDQVVDALAPATGRSAR